MFDEMMTDLRKEALTALFRAQVQTGEERKRPQQRQAVHAYKPEVSAGGEAGVKEQPKPAQVRRAEAKVGRNDPCPCGSGKKYKKCCGKESPE